MATLIKSDLDFILEQILLSEQHARDSWDTPGTPLAEVIGNPLLSTGLRTVDGSFNNLLAGQSHFGAADNIFPRLLQQNFRNDVDGDSFTVDTNGPAPGGLETLTNTNYANTGNTPNLPGGYFVSGDVVDANPRINSNLIVDQSSLNPAAVAAYNALQPEGSPLQTVQPRKLPDGSPNPDFVENLFIQNVAPDEGLSAPFNSWMTLFGQFFDHGLDLLTKGGNGVVYVPLMPDDPLYVEGGRTNFMVLTRATNIAVNPGADNVLGTSDDIHDHMNTTTSWVDQNQTYTSHPSHQVFLREYELDASGNAVATGKLLEGATGGLSTWADIKAQAAQKLGILLTDHDVTNVPLLATDEYGRFLPGANGFAQFVTATGLVEGVAGGLAIPANALRTGHAFLDDIAHSAAPFYDHDRNPSTPSIQATADADLVAGTNDGISSTYDNELLEAHFITGDGRGNENIGLTSVHHIFHSEHNRLVDVIKGEILASGDPSFIAQWQLPDGSWNGERLFQAARFGTEMQYQHLVFEEFARKVMPAVNVFAGIQSDIDASIVAEFAHTVYRFGHSMLTETIDRIDANGNVVDADPLAPGAQQIGLIEAFLNPLAYAARETSGGAAAGEVVRGMTRQVANEIDEFVTGALQNNLLGLPLDLPTINMARGRDTGIPGLNAARRQFHQMTGDAQLTPYTSWVDYGADMRHPESLINFVAAYGTHSSITSATTLADKRNAALLLVNGNTDLNGDGILELAPTDRLNFMNSTGAWASGSDGVTTTGLDAVDFWMGGLAEKQHPFGGLLGTTFGFVFETQMERLQDGDRLYYLSRTAGLNFLAELEGNSFADIIMNNTGVAGHLPADIFSRPDAILELNQALQLEPDPTGDDGTVTRNNPATPGPDSNYLKYTGGLHVVLGGSSGNDILIADIGDDTVWGDEGNDRIEGGAGNDQLIGGDGDDIITDSFGDDNIKGQAGNDVINAGAGIDLIIGGDGNDFVVAGSDEKETIAGRGNDFILGSAGLDTVFGDDGDDWIEGGDSADLLQGDSGDPFQLSPERGNDVIFGGGGNDDYDSESGDDIMITGQGTERFEGMLGFDWVTHTRDTLVGDSDLLFVGLLPVTIEPLRDRFDLVEGLSGWNQNDILRGDNRTSVELSAPVPEADNQNDALNSTAQISLISGLQGLLDGMFGTPQTSFNGGNIILGGDGNDTIEGRGGNDLIDGDKFLNVRLSWIDSSNVQRFANSMTEIQAQMFAGTLKPGQLSIVREIVTANGTGDIDTAEYNDIATNYTFSVIPDAGTGTWTIVDNDPLTGGPATGIFTPPIDEGTDTLRNIELLKFSDGAGGFEFVSLDPNAANQATTGDVIISDNTPDEDQTLTVSTDNLFDFNGMVNLSTIQFAWQAETAPGVWTTLLSNSNTFTPANAQAGQALRVVATFEDNLGHSESLTSAITAAVTNNNDTPSGSDREVTTNEDVARALTVADFGFTDPDAGDSLLDVRIDSLPVEGTLTFFDGTTTNNVAVSDIISAADIALGRLIYTPAADQNGEPYASFTFSVRDNAAATVGGTPAFDTTPNTLFVNVTPVNDTPVGADTTVTIAEDTSHTFAAADFGFTDVDSGDELRGVRVDTLPANGSLTLANVAVSVGAVVTAPQIASGLLVFTPDANGNGAGYASFTFSVQDLSQTFDAAAKTLTVDVTAVNDAPTGIPLVSDTTPTETFAVTADTSGIADVDVLGAFSYQWQVFSGGVWTVIGGAVSASFTPTQAQVNLPIRVQVSYTDGGGTTETLWSAATTVVGDFYNGTSAANVKAFTSGEDVANGLLGNDILSGLGGNDILNGGGGTDQLDGGDGADLVDGGTGNDTLLGGAGNDTLVGGTTSTGGVDTGADTLIGGEGADHMTGGGGNDVYEVDDVGDVVIEVAAGGTDRIETEFTTFSLAAAGLGQVENLTYTGEAVTFTGTGNALGNRIEGGDGDDRIDGGLGTDTMLGSLGNDTYVVNTQADIITELAGEGTDTVESAVTFSIAGAAYANVDNITLTGTGNVNATGNAGNNVLLGNSGNNVLAGGIGDDSMSGGAGNDTYIVGAVGDVVTENLGQGTDTVQTSLLSYTLGDNVENLAIAVGTLGNRIFTGNALNNVISGNGGNDSLNGGDGNDTLNGGAGNDILDGGALNDTMNGGLGDDTFIVNVSNDVVSELAAQGIDTVNSTANTYTITDADVENLTFTGVGNFTGTGNASANTLIGGVGNDTLNGNGGNDILNGGLGDDVMAGGANNDTYFVDSALDTVTEALSAGTDTVNTTLNSYTLGANVENLTFTGVGDFLGFGNTLNNRITGGSGNDIMTGNNGLDVFVFAASGFGQDEISDFDSNPLGGQDLLDVVGLGITSANFAASVTIAEDIEGTLVTIGADSILLGGVLSTTVDATDFILAP